VRAPPPPPRERARSFVWDGVGGVGRGRCAVWGGARRARCLDGVAVADSVALRERHEAGHDAEAHGRAVLGVHHHALRARLEARRAPDVDPEERLGLGVPQLDGVPVHNWPPDKVLRLAKGPHVRVPASARDPRPSSQATRWVTSSPAHRASPRERGEFGGNDGTRQTCASLAFSSMSLACVRRASSCSSW